MPRSAVLTYDGSKLHSSGAHIARGKSIETIGCSLETFRLRFTDVTQLTFVRIDIRNVDESQKAFVMEAHSRCTELLGEPTAGFGRRSQGTSNWFVDQSQFLPALRLLDAMRPIPSDHVGFGLLSVNYKIDFRFVDPASHEVLAFQEPGDYLNFEAEYERYLGRSYVSAELSERSSVSAFFSLPFEEWDENSESYVRAMQGELPFRISEKRWKRWHLNKFGTRYVGRKFSISRGRSVVSA